MPTFSTKLFAIQDEYLRLKKSLIAEMDKGREGDEVMMLLRETFHNRRQNIKGDRPIHTLTKELCGFKKSVFVSRPVLHFT